MRAAVERNLDVEDALYVSQAGPITVRGAAGTRINGAAADAKLDVRRVRITGHIDHDGTLNADYIDADLPPGLEAAKGGSDRRSGKGSGRREPTGDSKDSDGSDDGAGSASAVGSPVGSETDKTEEKVAKAQQDAAEKAEKAQEEAAQKIEKAQQESQEG